MHDQLTGHSARDGNGLARSIGKNAKFLPRTPTTHKVWQTPPARCAACCRDLGQGEKQTSRQAQISPQTGAHLSQSTPCSGISGLRYASASFASQGAREKGVQRHMKNRQSVVISHIDTSTSHNNASEIESRWEQASFQNQSKASENIVVHSPCTVLKP